MNVRSARWNPLVVLGVCAVLVVLSWQRHRWLHVLPAVVLGINAGLSFAFWMYRLKRSRGDTWWRVVVSIGSVSRVFGLAGLLTLGAAGTMLVAVPQWVTEHLQGPTWKFWVLWGWAAIELVHGHVYKLTFGSRDTLEYVLRGRRWAEAGKPLGGAIGQQLRKLRRRRAAYARGRKGADQSLPPAGP